MRKTIIAIVISLMLTSCASNDMGSRGTDGPGLLIIAALLGAGVAIGAH